jgi:hypothetical protein
VRESCTEVSEDVSVMIGAEGNNAMNDAVDEASGDTRRMSGMWRDVKMVIERLLKEIARARATKLTNSERSENSHVRPSQSFARALKEPHASSGVGGQIPKIKSMDRF